ncbi:hypothetical protein [Paucisalibacillus sp. EB02]|uniref:hypothetical protein n=1 Tax=Paucisalibacillus sp. EB02 TaxID=1347087 RepID=UPI0005A7D450|nr:hypothetical protein [Paucisalibacillus sp. EB02]
MTQLSPEEKREIVREELHHLVKARYISLNIAAKIVNVHTKYYQNLPKVNQIKQELEKPQQPETETRVNVVKQEIREKDTTNTPSTQPVIQSTKKPIKTLTAQQVRERNITWALNLGVILVLLGGLVLATSTWDILGNWMKTGLITAVSVLFFALAWLTNRVLHIKKTAFAFLVLGGLFLPIVVVSAGYFELFGHYLSFSGDGKYLFGAIGTLIVLPIYVFLAMKFASRLFVWFSYISISVFVGLLIASLYLPIDGFYFGVMLYNAVLILGYRVLENNKKVKQFVDEFIPFIQANIILSTLLMLVFYDNELMYSFNLILTAVIYFSMIYVTNHKSYHFVFTAMIIYGSYQLVENSILEGVSEIAYALLGVIFLVIPKLVKDSGSLQKVFRITSAIVSSLAFIYISFEGMLLQMGEGSLVLVVAYVIIALNFAYLVSMVKSQLFTYLSPIFFVSAIYQLALIGEEWIGYESIILPFFVLVFALYLVGGCLVKVKRWEPLMVSTRDISGLILLFSLLIGVMDVTKLELSAMLVLLAVLAIVMARFESRTVFVQVAPWMHGVSMGLAVAVLYRHFIPYAEMVYMYSQIRAEEIILGSLAVLVLSYSWKAMKKQQFMDSSFYIAQIFFGFGILLSLGFETDSGTRALITLGGIGMAILLYRKTSWPAIPYVISGMTLTFYLSVLVLMYDRFTQIPVVFEWFEFIIGTLLLLGIGLVVRNKDELLTKAYYWIGQLFLPLALLLSLLSSQEDAIWAFLIATVIYGVTVRLMKTEWKIKTFFYAGFTTLWAFLLLVFVKLDWQDSIAYTFFIISIILFVGWQASSEVWKKRIIYYFLPYSSIGMLSFILNYPYDLLLFVITILYGVLVLFVLHRMKWDILSIIPLLLLYAAVANVNVTEYRTDFEPMQHAIFGIVLMILGLVLYKSLYQLKQTHFKIDWYTILALIVFFNLYQYSFGSLFNKVLPGILIVTLLFFNRKRVADISAKWLIFAAFVYLLQPYYAMLGHFELPALFEREFYVLPWIAVVIGLRSYVMKENTAVTGYLQWAVLVIVAILLVQDGLASNTIYDALIVGVLSLASLIAGMMYQIKSFFFVGTGVLLFNVFMQTRPYWGNLPWWGYLLIAGSILIAVASYNEWQKQKSSEGKETLVSKFKKNVIERIKKWD